MNNDHNDAIQKGFLYTGLTVLFFIFFSLAILYGAFVGAFVAVHLWAWFVVPTFGLAVLKMPAAVGIGLLISLWTIHVHPGHKDDRDWKEKLTTIIGQLLSPWFVLLVGYICHRFFM